MTNFLMWKSEST